MVAIPGCFASICDVTSESVYFPSRLAIADPYIHINWSKYMESRSGSLWYPKEVGQYSSWSSQWSRNLVSRLANRRQADSTQPTCWFCSTVTHSYQVTLNWRFIMQRARHMVRLYYRSFLIKPIFLFRVPNGLSCFQKLAHRVFDSVFPLSRSSVCPIDKVTLWVSLFNIGIWSWWERCERQGFCTNSEWNQKPRSMAQLTIHQAIASSESSHDVCR